jgi:hypothetical protein
LFTDPEFLDVNNSYFVPGFGVSGKIYRNYVFGMPVQIFIMLEINWMPTTIYDLAVIKDNVIQYAPLRSGYAKIGLAYNFRQAK